MAESYVVESRLVAVDELGPVLRRAAREARGLFDVLERLKGGGGSITTVSDVVGRLNEKLGATATVAAKMGQAVAAGADVATRGLIGAVGQANALAVAMERVSRASGSVRMGGGSSSFIPAGRPSAGATWRPANNNSPLSPLSIPAAPPFADRHYNVHTGGRPPGPPVSPPGGHGSGSDPLNQVIGGAISLGMGVGIVKGLNALATSGGVLGAAQAALRMQMANDPNRTADYATAMTAATGLIKQFPQIKLSNAVGMLSDIYSVTGSAPEAAVLAPTVGAYQAVAASIPGHKASAKALMKAAEASGYTVDPSTHKFSAGRVETFVAMATKLLEATHGTVDETALQNFFRQAGPSGRNLTISAIMQLAPTFTEMGPQKAGTAMASAYQEIIGGTMTEKVADALEKIHMLNAEAIHKTRVGIRVDPGAVKGSSLFATNPVQWVNTVLVPQLKKEHPNWGPTQTNQELTQIFGRQTVQRLFADLISQSGQYAKDFKQENQAATASQALAILNASYYQNVTNFTTALASLGEVFGADVTPTLIPGLKALTTAIQDVTGAAMAHPEAAKIIAGSAAGVGALAIAAGSVLVPLGALRLAIIALRGTSVTTAAGGAVTAAEGLGLGGIAAAAAPIGAAIAAGFIAHMGFKWLSDKIDAMAPPNNAGPRDGYRPLIAPNPAVPKISFLPPQALPSVAAHHRPDGSISRGGYSGTSQPITVNVTTNMTADGVKLATVVTRHQVNAMKAPSSGSSTFDDRQHPAWPSNSTAVR